MQWAASRAGSLGTRLAAARSDFCQLHPNEALHLTTAKCSAYRAVAG